MKNGNKTRNLSGIKPTIKPGFGPDPVNNGGMGKLVVIDAKIAAKPLFMRNSWTSAQNKIKKETGDKVLAKVRTYLENKGWAFPNIGPVKRQKSSLPTGRILQPCEGNYYLILGCFNEKGERVDLGYNDGVSIETGYVMKEIPEKTPKVFPTIMEDHLKDMKFFRFLNKEIEKEQKEEREFLAGL